MPDKSQPVMCSYDGCREAVPTKGVRVSMFDRIRAQELGWFFQRDGTRWCPNHLPDWVGPWRERQKVKKEQKS